MPCDVKCFLSNGKLIGPMSSRTVECQKKKEAKRTSQTTGHMVKSLAVSIDCNIVPVLSITMSAAEAMLWKEMPLNHTTDDFVTCFIIVGICGLG